MKQKLLILFLVLSFLTGYSSVGDRIDRQVLVQVSQENSSKEYLSTLFPEATITLTALDFQIWRLEFPESIPIERVKKYYLDGKIINFMRNRKLEVRSTKPNDSLFNNQTFHFNDFNPGQTITYGINSIGAWDFDKKGITARGDTIVVAVCDFGFDSAHDDLDYFINYNEIPNDGIDNDLNGARDDYRGWNVGRDSNNLSGDNNYHGMAVCGAIAAKGNNKKGVSGVAWNCKLLPLNNIADISYSIKAFQYCIRMKRDYLNSKGKKGAYIVAINYSLGITNFFLPEDEPLWCSVFDSLGTVGILASCAVANSQQESVTLKDMPILCNSPYMVNVTTYNYSTLGLDGSAFSSKYVHVAAPHKYFSLIDKNRYGMLGWGSSHAAPIISGTLALMYSNLDTCFLDSLHKNPTKMVLHLKNTIIAQVDTTPNLKNMVVSNGKLNVYKTILATRNLKTSLSLQCKKDTVTGSASLVGEKRQVDLYSYNRNLVVRKANNLPLLLNVYDLLGKSVYQAEVRANEIIIDLNYLVEGIYIVTSSQSNGDLVSKKILLK